jgi:hypothetical protein
MRGVDVCPQDALARALHEWRGPTPRTAAAPLPISMSAPLVAACFGSLAASERSSAWSSRGGVGENSRRSELGSLLEPAPRLAMPEVGSVLSLAVLCNSAVFVMLGLADGTLGAGLSAHAFGGVRSFRRAPVRQRCDGTHQKSTPNPLPLQGVASHADVAEPLTACARPTLRPPWHTTSGAVAPATALSAAALSAACNDASAAASATSSPAASRASSFLSGPRGAAPTSLPSTGCAAAAGPGWAGSSFLVQLPVSPAVRTASEPGEAGPASSGEMAPARQPQPLPSQRRSTGVAYGVAAEPADAATPPRPPLPRRSTAATGPVSAEPASTPLLRPHAAGAFGAAAATAAEAEAAQAGGWQSPGGGMPRRTARSSDLVLFTSSGGSAAAAPGSPGGAGGPAWPWSVAGVATSPGCLAGPPIGGGEGAGGRSTSAAHSAVAVRGSAPGAAPSPGCSGGWALGVDGHGSAARTSSSPPGPGSSGSGAAGPLWGSSRRSAAGVVTRDGRSSAAGAASPLALTSPAGGADAAAARLAARASVFVAALGLNE